MAFLTHLLFGFFLLIQVHGEDVKHNLPDNLEIVDPKSLGLAGTDLDKFLGNVKLLPITGNGLLPKDSRTKTQILTVGFEGDEGLNLDDFELPSVDGLPDAEKTVAQAAFSRFQEFFKNPNKSKTIIDDEDLIEETTRGDVKKILTTTPASTLTTTSTPTTTTTTTPAPSTSSSPFGTFRRPVYRPRTPLPYVPPTTTKSYVSRTRKFKRPGTFRRTTSTTPIPPSTSTYAPRTTPASFYQKFGGRDKKPVEFKPEQFQDYASIIRDLQGAGPRGPPEQSSPPSPPRGGGDGLEGAPNGLLGFQPVHEPGHSGPPIFEFGGPSDKNSKPFQGRPFASSSTTERHENDQGNTQNADYSRQNNNGFVQNNDHNRFLVNNNNNQHHHHQHHNQQQQFHHQHQEQQSVNTFLNNNNNNEPNRFSQQLINNNPFQPQQQQQQSPSQKSNQFKTFEQISAEPVGTVHVESTKIPYEFPPQPAPQPQQPQQQQPFNNNNNIPQQQPQQQLVQNAQNFRQSPFPPQAVPFQPQQQLQFVQEQFQRQQQALRPQQQVFQQQQQLPRQPIAQPQIPFQQNQQRGPGQLPPQQQQPFQQHPIPHQQQQSQQRPQSVINFPQQQQQQHQLRQLNNNERPNAFAQPPPLLVNQNFLRPNINEKFFLPTETPKHVVRNPINLFASGQNSGVKPPQIFPLSTIENVVQPNFNPNRFILPQQQQQPDRIHQQPSSIVSHFINPNSRPQPYFQFGARSSSSSVSESERERNAEV